MSPQDPKITEEVLSMHSLSNLEKITFLMNLFVRQYTLDGLQFHLIIHPREQIKCWMDETENKYKEHILFRKQLIWLMVE
jgi:hypothetical protein